MSPDKLSGSCPEVVRGRTGRTTPPLKGVSVRCPVSADRERSERVSARQRARNAKLDQVRQAREALGVMLRSNK